MLMGGGGGEMTASNEALKAMLDDLERGGDTAANYQALKKLIAEAKRYKPEGLDVLTERIRARYHSRGGSEVAAEIVRRFPDSHESMPVHETDTVRHTMTQDASVFGHDVPNAWITFERPGQEDEGNEAAEPTPEERERMKAFADVIEDAELWDELHEAEKWVRGARNCVLSFSWDTVHEALTGKGRVKVQRHWASQVECIPLHASATEERAALCWIFQTQGPKLTKQHTVDDDEAFFHIWSREVTIGDDGKVTFSPWNAEIVGTKSGSRPMYGDGVYPLPTAPFVVFRDGRPDATLFLDPGEALLRFALNVDVEWSSHFSRVDLNAFPFLVIDDPDFDGKTGVKGPGKGIAVSKGTQVNSIGSDVSDIGLETIREMRKEAAVHRNQSHDAYDPGGGGTNESGFAKQVRNIDKDRNDEKRKRQAKKWLENVVLPMVAEIADYWGNTGIMRRRRDGEATSTAAGDLIGDVSFHVDLAPAMSYEDPKSKWERVSQQVADGFLSPEDGLVELGICENSEDAKAYLESFNSKLLRRGALDAQSEGAISNLVGALQGQQQQVANATATDQLERQLGDEQPVDEEPAA